MEHKGPQHKEWDEVKYRAFKRSYDEAYLKQQPIFEFEGKEYVTLYAKYVLEYLRVGLRLEDDK